MPKVSVIIPTLGEPETEQAVDSALAQDVPVEIVLVDDSPDGVGDIDGVDIHLRPDTATVGAARNRGVAAATGDYIGLLDADDIWMEGKCTRQLQKLTEEEGDICTTGHVSPQNTHIPEVTPPAHQLKQVSLGVPSSVLGRREVFEETQFVEEARIWEERDWYARVLSQYGVVTIDEPLVRRRLTDGLTGSADLIAADGIPLVVNRARDFDAEASVRGWALRRLSMVSESRTAQIKHALRAVRWSREWPIIRRLLKSFASKE